jgi:hypothetical protein
VYGEDRSGAHPTPAKISSTNATPTIGHTDDAAFRNIDLCSLSFIDCRYTSRNFVLRVNSPQRQGRRCRFPALEAWTG